MEFAIGTEVNDVLPEDDVRRLVMEMLGWDIDGFRPFSGGGPGEGPSRDRLAG